MPGKVELRFNMYLGLTGLQSSPPIPSENPTLPFLSVVSMSEFKEENSVDAPVNTKRNTDPESLTPDSKKHKPEYPNADLRKSVAEPNEVKEEDEEEERKIASNGKSATDKGKAVVVEDKGKGKLPDNDTDSSSSSDSAEDLEEDGEDNEVLDDPLAEVDLSNILPSRTRRRVADPGAYLVNDLDDDDDDDDDENDEDEEDSGRDDSD